MTLKSYWHNNFGARCTCFYRCQFVEKFKITSSFRTSWCFLFFEHRSVIWHRIGVYSFPMRGCFFCFLFFPFMLVGVITAVCATGLPMIFMQQPTAGSTNTNTYTHRLKYMSTSPTVKNTVPLYLSRAHI